MILEKTVELIKSIYKYHKIIPPKINRVIIGLGYTGVELVAYAYEPFLGLAYTLPSIIRETSCSKINFAGNLTNMKLNQLLEWSYAAPNIKKIIGIATLNAMSQHVLKVKNPYEEIKEDLLEYLKIKEDSKVTFIGQIGPLIKQASKYTQKIIIIEDSQNISKSFKRFPCFNDLNQLKEDDLKTDILFCTGTTLINNTLETILKRYQRKAKKIILIGPTASMLPDILFDQGVDIVGGMQVRDVDATIHVIQQAGGTKLFKAYCKKYNFVNLL
ncbi:MAG: hypothetical protein EU539_06735 [Promethearchaeota archaeon]|nr:MAG: hypothetical protein EU539_06735 [Candidatus Lokiarchaeota archaeon]